MELETIRALQVGATDPTIGINTMIAGLTLDGADARPPNVTVYNSVDHGWVARHELPDNATDITLPAIAIFVHQPADFPEAEVETIVRDGHYPVAFAYATKKSDTAQGNRDALYTMRAILRFLKLFNANANAAMRTRNGIIVQAAVRLEGVPLNQAWGNALLIGAIAVTYLVRETSP